MESILNKSQIAGFAIGPLAAAGLGIITMPILTWIFSAEDIGRLAMLQVVMSLCTIVFSFGLDQAYVREYHETDNKARLLLAALTPGLLSIVIIFSILLFTKPQYLSELLFSIKSKSISLLVLVCITSAYVARFLSLILRMKNKGLAYSMSQLLSRVTLLFIVLLYLFFTKRYEFKLLILAQACAICITVIVFAWNTRFDWVPAIRAQIDFKELHRLMQFGSPLVIGGAASWALSAMDRVFLRSLSTYEELAIYSVAASIASAITIASGIFNTIWAPFIYKLIADRNDLSIIGKVKDSVLAMIALIFSVIGGLSWIVAFILPHKYEHVQYLIIGCMVPPVLYTVSEITAIGIAVSKRTIFSMFASLTAVVVNVVGNIFLVPNFGATGAMSATAIAFLIFFVMRTELAIKLWKNFQVSRLELYLFFAILTLVAISIPIFGPFAATALPVSSLFVGLIFLWLYRQRYLMIYRYFVPKQSQIF